MVCRGQLGELASKRFLFDRRDARIFAISVDDPATSRAFSERIAGPNGVGYPLLSDPDRKVIRAFGVEMAGQDIAVPALFILAPGGRIVWRQVGESVTDRPTSQVVLYELDKARRKYR